jgi:hypothetical protein
MRGAWLFSWLLGLSASAIAHADDGQRVHRCVGEHGEIVFSGLPCGAGARIGADAGTSASNTQSAVALACPRSAGELRSVLGDALSRHDTNAVASLVRWDGVRGAEARERLREIADLGARPLLGIELDAGAEAAFESSGETDGESPPVELVVRTGSDEHGSPREHAFRIGASSGCYWLDW